MHCGVVRTRRRNSRCNLFTPPVIPASRIGDGGLGDVSGSIKGLGDSFGGDEELDLMYDPILNFYYDPKTNKYYELL